MNIKMLTGLGLTAVLTVSGISMCFAENSILEHKNINLSGNTLEVFTGDVSSDEIKDSSGNTKRIEIAEIMRYDENGGINIGEILEGAPNIKVIPSNDPVNIGDEFYVDFVLNNNGGLKDYSFRIEYDPKVIVPVEGYNGDITVNVGGTDKTKCAVDADLINKSISSINDENSSFSFKGSVNTKNYRYIKTANGNGVLFKVKFKAVGKGKTAIRVDSGSEDYIVRGVSPKITPVYVQNARVTVQN